MPSALADWDQHQCQDAKRGYSINRKRTSKFAPLSVVASSSLLGGKLLARAAPEGIEALELGAGERMQLFWESTNPFLVGYPALYTQTLIWVVGVRK